LSIDIPPSGRRQCEPYDTGAVQSGRFEEVGTSNMDTKTLGAGGPEISVIGFGAWEAGGDMWGPNESNDQVISAIRAAIDAGMTWIDTAEVYGSGRSEELVGAAVKGHRDEVLLFTKWGPREDGGSDEGGGPNVVRRAIRASLGRLGTDHVDLYQIHWPPDGMPIEEAWGAMAQVQDEGLARHIGVSNFDRGLIERCLPIRHVDSVQNQFSLLRQDDRAELLPWLDENGIGYLAYGPLAFGLLTGAITRDSAFHARDWRSGGMRMSYYDRLFAPGKLEPNLEKVERLKAVAERLGTTAATVALRWALEQPGVTAGIAGSRNQDHVRSNAQAGDLKLESELLKELKGIFG